MRETPGNAPESTQTPMVTKLLVITIGVFILQQVLNVFFPGPPGPNGSENSFLWEWFALNGENFGQLKIWTVLSYGFLHSTLNLLHIVGNMLGLYFIGRILEPMLGRQWFLLLYLSSIIIGGLTYLALHLGDSQVVVGASAGVFGVVTLFCILHPERPITLLLFFILPITIKPKWLLRISVGLSLAGLLFYELPGAPGSSVAHSAHLGGMLAGFLYYRYAYLRRGALFKRPGPAKASVELPEWFKNRKQQAAAEKITYTVNRSQSRDELQQEVDRILDKINVSGFGSLNNREKQTLDHAKDILR
jgi:membrane associated rhomboid family serine protease